MSHLTPDNQEGSGIYKDSVLLQVGIAFLV